MPRLNSVVVASIVTFSNIGSVAAMPSRGLEALHTRNLLKHNVGPASVVTTEQTTTVSFPMFSYIPALYRNEPFKGLGTEHRNMAVPSTEAVG